mgnify:CR=1 FL=1
MLKSDLEVATIRALGSPENVERTFKTIPIETGRVFGESLPPKVKSLFLLEYLCSIGALKNCSVPHFVAVSPELTRRYRPKQMSWEKVMKHFELQEGHNLEIQKFIEKNVLPIFKDHIIVRSASEIEGSISGAAPGIFFSGPPREKDTRLLASDVVKVIRSGYEPSSIAYHRLKGLPVEPPGILFQEGLKHHNFGVAHSVNPQVINIIITKTEDDELANDRYSVGYSDIEQSGLSDQLKAIAQVVRALSDNGKIAIEVEFGFDSTVKLLQHRFINFPEERRLRTEEMSEIAATTDSPVPGSVTFEHIIIVPEISDRSNLSTMSHAKEQLFFATEQLRGLPYAVSVPPKVITHLDSGYHSFRQFLFGADVIIERHQKGAHTNFGGSAGAHWERMLAENGQLFMVIHPEELEYFEYYINDNGENLPIEELQIEGFLELMFDGPYHGSKDQRHSGDQVRILKIPPLVAISNPDKTGSIMGFTKLELPTHLG